MDNRVNKYLQDVLTAIDEICFFMESRPREYAVFCEDLLFRRGVERNIEIMGEAMNKALKLNPEQPTTNNQFS